MQVNTDVVFTTGLFPNALLLETFCRSNCGCMKKIKEGVHAEGLSTIIQHAILRNGVHLDSVGLKQQC